MTVIEDELIKEYTDNVIQNEKPDYNYTQFFETLEFDYKIFFEDFTEEETLNLLKFMETENKLNCYTLFKYIKKLYISKPDTEIIRLKKINEVELSFIGDQINEGSNGTIYNHKESNLLVKVINNEDELYYVLFYPIILNLESIYELIPKIIKLYYNPKQNKIYIIMEKYTSDLKVFFTTVFEDEYRNIVFLQISKLLLKLYKLNLICADIKLENFVIRYKLPILGEKIDIKSIDIKFIDIEMDFCDCLNNKDLTYDKALLFVDFYLHFLNLQSKDKLLELGKTYYQFYKLLYDFLFTFDEYLFIIDDIPCDKISQYYIKKCKLSEPTSIIEFDHFSKKLFDEKIEYLNLSGDENIYELLLYCIYLKCKFKYTTPLRYYFINVMDIEVME